ncbi:MAG: hypothetical protein V1685_04495 [Parcubacteria group bacterium]
MKTSKFKYHVAGKDLLLNPPFHHDPYCKYFRISPWQRRKISPANLTIGMNLYVIAERDYDPGICPHCHPAAAIKEILRPEDF